MTLLGVSASEIEAPAQGSAVLKPDVVLEDVVLTADLADGQAAFTLTATARVTARRGATLDLMGGNVALTEVAPHNRWRVRTEQGRFLLEFDRSGEYAVQLKFRAAVESKDGWNRLAFHLAPGPLQRMVMRQLPPDTQFEFPGAARPEREGDDFVSMLPVDGAVRLGWKESKKEGEGRLFFAAEALAQMTVSQGLLRQTALLQFRVMQGELTKVVIGLEGEGEITRVQGAQVLSWAIEAATANAGRRLVVHLNQPQKDAFLLVVQAQQPLGTFPLAIDPLRLQPEEATRFAGHIRIVNEGAVRLEVLQADGLSQISPEQFPVNETFQGLGLPAGTQTFAYRFSGVDSNLRFQADNILPELGVSEVVVYHLGETELAIDSELELDVREAPLRELGLTLPRGYALARLQASGMSDYFTSDGPDDTVLLRVVYGQPVLGRQVVQLRLERNSALAETVWELPRIVVSRAKTVRGHVGVSADAGFRLTPGTISGLTDIATAFFPKKVVGLQSAFRLNEAAWQASVTVERLAQSIQADVFHLFSVGEGIAYGSSVVNYLVSGAPVSTFRVELSDEYFNVEFTGREIRNWQKVDGGFLVQLHTPVSGAYALLATYERPFRAGGETLGFSGMRPSDAQTEQGYSLVISAYQFQVRPVNVSSNLLALEPGEVPPEYRLFFDAPLLAAYRYTTRPFSLDLELEPLAQGDTLSQVVDRAVFSTRLSAEGQVITDVRYFVKSKGSPWLRVTVPPDQELWSVMVNGTRAVPVQENQSTLIPLPGRSDPDTVQTVDMKLAGRTPTSGRLVLSPPSVAAPVLLAEWTLSPDEGHRLIYRRGSLTPVNGPQDASGFLSVWHSFSGVSGPTNLTRLGLAIFLALAAVWIWRLTAGPEVYRWSPRHILGGGLGLVAGLASLAILIHLAQEMSAYAMRNAAGLRFVIPVQQAGAAPALEISNVKVELSWWTWTASIWPVFVGLVLWIVALVRWEGGMRRFGVAAAWTCLTWGALRVPGAASALFLLLGAYILFQVLWPAWRALSRIAVRPLEEGSPAAATVGLVILVGLMSGMGARADEAVATVAPIYADSITQEVRVEDGFVQASATIRWTAEKGEVLPLLLEPAVMTALEYPESSLELVGLKMPGGRATALRAKRDGSYDITVRYQTREGQRDGESGFVLPTLPALVSKLALTLPDLDAEVKAPTAVSIRRDDEAPVNTTMAHLVLAPASEAWIGWRPRSRDTRSERTVFYAEVQQIYVPSAGALEGLHLVVLRPAQGELQEVTCDVPAGFTIADASGTGLGLWRFDPDTRKLRLTFSPPQARVVAVSVRSQLTTGPLPYEQSVGVLRVEGAAAQIGLLGVATGPEVQLDDAHGEAFTAINLEDFPTAVLEALHRQNAGLALRRAFRYGETVGELVVKAAAVEPDVRVESQQTFSLGEDRTLLAANLNVEITRAGIFRLSFALPSGLDVESISGPALSHWTELKDGTERVITLHLKGKTEGAQAFAITLAGPGLRQAQGWELPRLSLREASKQRGQLMVVPEQGMRLQVTGRDGVTQLDPARSGIRQKGVLSFRLLQDPWRVALDVEQVDSWIQVTSLQDVRVAEGQLKVAVNLLYQIENTGVKSLRVRLPATAEGVRFQGEQVADYVGEPTAAGATNRMWEVKLHRRILGAYFLQVTYQVPQVTQTAEIAVVGVQAADVNLQRGYLTVRSEGRLQLSIVDVPASLQPAEWQSIPRRLHTEELAAALQTYRLVEADFVLPVRLERREAVHLLPARVNSVVLNSVVSDDGVMLTQVRLELTPGDKRLLHLTLPAAADFWFAFVNQRGVWPWRQAEEYLIPLDQQSKSDAATVVEIFYTLPTTPARGRSLELEVAGPKFDLPLENVTWRVHLNRRWRLKDWEGTLQLKEEHLVAGRALDLESYIQTETAQKQEQIREAENLITLGNTFLQQGDPQQARRAFQAAYGLSQHDDAFNEDARVQLHNLKMQQALIGLNNRLATVAGETDTPALRLRSVAGAAPSYTQEEAKQILDRNSAEDNAVQMKLAERLVQQQEAALPSPAAIRATVPEEGRLMTFTRSLLVDKWADLSLRIAAQTAAPIPAKPRFVILGGLLLVLTVLAFAARPQEKPL